MYSQLFTQMIRKFTRFCHLRLNSFLPSTGAVALIQRFGLAPNLNSHLHMLFLDGAYAFSDKRVFAIDIEFCADASSSAFGRLLL
jgi:hypothetical protein